MFVALEVAAHVVEVDGADPCTLFLPHYVEENGCEHILVCLKLLTGVLGPAEATDDSPGDGGLHHRLVFLLQEGAG